MNERLTAGRRHAAGDEGFTLIEVMVALLVFAIVSTGIVAASSTIIQMTADNRARITAANLASQDLDVVRAIADPFSITKSDGSVPIDGRTYHLTRSVSWISAAGTDVSCNSSTNLFFLRVNVRVTWDGMLGTTKAVQDDTILAPTDGTTDSETGAIAISVTDDKGDAVSGVAATVTPVVGGTGAPLAAAPKNTTAEGCTYANDVTPGAYTVKITKTGFVDQAQLAAPVQTVTVSAGNTQSVVFTYAQAATFKTTYGTGPVSYSGSPTPPSDLPTNFIAGSNISTTTVPLTSVARFPFSTGYAIVVGPLTDGTTNCASVDPQAWTAGLVNGVQLSGGVRPTAAAAAGGSANVTIPMGVVRVRATAGRSYTATQALAQGVGNPGCALTGTTLDWTSKSTGGWDELQLPYGSWTIKAAGTAIPATDEQVVTNVAQQGVSLDGTVTLDPRKAK